MRKIIFRGKLLANPCEWVEGYLFEFDIPKSSYILGELDFRDSIYDVWKCAEEVIPKTVGQWTGRLDKNGKKIFEDDVVKTKYGRLCYVHWFESPTHVGWDMDPVITTKNCSTKAPDAYDLWGPENLEVVGNIHDNRNLEDLND